MDESATPLNPPTPPKSRLQAKGLESQPEPSTNNSKPRAHNPELIHLNFPRSKRVKVNIETKASGLGLSRATCENRTRGIICSFAECTAGTCSLGAGFKAWGFRFFGVPVLAAGV